MAKVVITLEDSDEGVKVQLVSDTPIHLGDDFADKQTPAQIVAGKMLGAGIEDDDEIAVNTLRADGVAVDLSRPPGSLQDLCFTAGIENDS